MYCHSLYHCRKHRLPNPVPVDLGDTIEYYVRVNNIHDNDDLTNVEVKIHVDDSLEPDISTAKYNLTSTPSVSVTTIY